MKLSKNFKRKEMLKILFSGICLGVSVLCFADVHEAPILKNNLEQVRTRGISIVPLPKRIEFAAPVYPEKVVISGSEKQPFFKIICEELKSRFEELKSPVKVQVSDKPEAGAYNIMIKDTFTKPAGLPRLADGCEDQLYTLTPVRNGIELAGTKDALYAAVTLRHLIVREKGRTAIYPAKVIDWPDFPARAISLSEPFLRRHINNPEQYAKYTKPLIRRLMRLKINEIRKLPRSPQQSALRLFSSGPLMNETDLNAMRAFHANAAECGILCGQLEKSFSLGTKQDEQNPFFKNFNQKSRWGSSGHYHSWARTDLYEKIAARCHDFLKQSEWDILFVHGVDTGGTQDPELWSHRDEPTRKRFGDDRAAADAAVFMEFCKAMAGTSAKRMLAVVYPYCGYNFNADDVMRTERLPQTAEGRKLAEALVRRESTFLKRIHTLLPKDRVSICLREGNRNNMRLFTSHVPGRVVDIYWEASNVWRDVLPLVSPELLSTGSGFEPERNGRNNIWRTDGGAFREPENTAFAERAWNSCGEYYTDLDRTRNPLRYDPEALRFLARRAAEGIWGVELGKKLCPLFDNMLSLSYAVDPFEPKKQCTSSTFDLKKYVERNDRQIRLAKAAFDSVYASRDKENFTPGSYPLFMDFLHMLQAAPVYSGVNLAVIQMQESAKKGNNALAEKIYKKALADLAAGEKAYQQFVEKTKSEPHQTLPSDLAAWDKKSVYRQHAILLAPDFKELKKKLDNAKSEVPKLFAQSNSPAFLQIIAKRNRNLYAVPEKSASPWMIRHWYHPRDLILCPVPVTALLRNTGKALRLEAEVYSAGIGNASMKEPKKGVFPAGESMELFLAAPTGPYANYHFVVGAGGGFYTARLGKETGAKYDTFESGLAPKVVREKDCWKLTLEVPYSLLGAIPGKGWKVLLGVNTAEGSFASTYLAHKAAGSAFHDMTKWQALLFRQNAPKPECGLHDITFEHNLETMENRTHTSGTGTWLSFKPAFNTAVPVWAERFTVQITDAEHKALSNVVTLAENKHVPARCQNFEPLTLQLEQCHNGIIFRFELQYTIDGKSFTLRHDIPAGTFAESGKERRFPFLSDIQANTKKGRIEFAFKPEWDDLRSVTSGEIVLLHGGPINRVFNFSDTVTLTYNRMWQSLRLGVTTKDRQTRGIYSQLPFKKGTWYDMALEWDFTGRKAFMKMTCNGKELKGEITKWGKPAPESPAFTVEPASYPVMFGIRNDGKCFSGCTIRLK